MGWINQNQNLPMLKQLGSAASDSGAPGVPENLAFDVQSTQNILFTWDAPISGGPVDQYAYEWQLAGEDWSTPIGQDSTTDLEILIIGLSPNTEYDFRVRSENVDGESAWVEASNVLTFPEGTTSFLIGNASANSIDATWDAPPVNVSTNIFINTTDDFGGASDLGSQTSPFTAGGLAAETQYWFWAVASNVSGSAPEVASSPQFETTLI